MLIAHSNAAAFSIADATLVAISDWDHSLGVPEVVILHGGSWIEKLKEPKSDGKLRFESSRILLMHSNAPVKPSDVAHIRNCFPGRGYAAHDGWSGLGPLRRREVVEYLFSVPIIDPIPVPTSAFLQRFFGLDRPVQCLIRDVAEALLAAPDVLDRGRLEEIRLNAVQAIKTMPPGR